jgi:hypothetical protein
VHAQSSVIGRVDRGSLFSDQTFMTRPAEIQYRPDPLAKIEYLTQPTNFDEISTKHCLLFLYDAVLMIDIHHRVCWLFNDAVTTGLLASVGHSLESTPTNGRRFTALSLPWRSPIQLLTEVDHRASLGRHRAPRYTSSPCTYAFYRATACLLFLHTRHIMSSQYIQ